MQKEKLSALMDGELIDQGVCHALINNRELQEDWYRYHLIRDSLKGETHQFSNLTIADQVMSAILAEPDSTPLLSESQPKPGTWRQFSFWHKVKPLFNQVGQIGAAACVSLAVITGYQHYNQSDEASTSDLSSLSTLSTFSIGGMASPVSYGTAMNNRSDVNNLNIQEQRRRIAILQDYELQRRIYAVPLTIDSDKQESINSVELGSAQ